MPTQGVLNMAYGLNALFTGVYERYEVAPSLQNAAQQWTRTGVDTNVWSAVTGNPYMFTHTPTNGINRVVEVAAFSSVTSCANFTETLPDGTEYQFTYDATPVSYTHLTLPTKRIV